MSEICACQFAATQNTPRAVIVPATSQTHRQSGGCGQLGETTLHQPEGDPFTGRVGLLEDVDRDDRSEPVRDPRRRDHQAGAQIRPASLPELTKLTAACPSTNRR